MTTKHLNRLCFLVFFFTLAPLSTNAQSIVEELEAPSLSRGLEEMTFAETIILASKSKRIFILTNKNQSLEPGDFVTMLVNGQQIVRGLIAKTKQGKSAFKVLKTYNNQVKTKLKRGMTVRLYRGDENQLTANSSDNNLRINNEADLFSDSILLDEKEKTKELSSITSNNIIQMGYGLLGSIDNSGDSSYYNHFVLSWNYRVKQFVWIESVLGYSAAKRFPADDISTDLYNLTARIKYNYELPFYSYIMPYAGIQIVLANSPEAGQGKPNTAQGQLEADREEELVSDAQKIYPALGITYMKRFVPSWFLTVNLGIDLINVGLAIEF